MTGEEMRNARAVLGKMWGFGRPLHAAEMGRALRLGGRDPGETVLAYEKGKHQISGPVSICVEHFLAGVMPPDGIDHVRGR